MTENGAVTAWQILPSIPEKKILEINDIYEIKDCYDNEGRWKGYLCSVVGNERPLNPIQPYDVPIKYDENKELDKVKSFNGLQ
jgi:hypothetical protein